MMDKNKKKSDNLGILSTIYHNEKNLQSNVSIIGRIKQYFSDPKKSEAWLSGAVLFLGSLGIIFGLFHFKNLVKSSQLFPESRTVADTNLNSQSAVQPDLLGLKQRDTDQDGLSDYDETYIYHTSAYLPDSDSDGMDDMKEIARGSDPNCPIGQDCFAFINTFDEETSTADQSSLPEGSTAQLRQILEQAGMPAETLNSLTDDEVWAAYQQVIAEAGNATSTPAQTVDLPVSQLKDLTPDQLRKLLSQAGVGSDILDKISDEELMNLAQETLQEQGQ